MNQIEFESTKSRDPKSAIVLQEMLSFLSEVIYFVSWLHDWEYMVWYYLDHRIELSQSHFERLEDLRDRSGGWWIYDAVEGEKFVTTEEFELMFENWKRRNNVL